MKTYYSLSEKRAYIDDDFQKSKLYNMGPVPVDREECIAYIRKMLVYAKEFLTKYDGKGWSLSYAALIVDDWTRNIEKIVYGRLEK